MTMLDDMMTVVKASFEMSKASAEGVIKLMERVDAIQPKEGVHVELYDAPASEHNEVVLECGEAEILEIMAVASDKVPFMLFKSQDGEHWFEALNWDATDKLYVQARNVSKFVRLESYPMTPELFEKGMGVNMALRAR